MEDETVLACGRIGVVMSDEPLEDLKRLKTVALISGKFWIRDGEHIFALKMEKSIFTKKKFPRLIRRLLKKTEYRIAKPPRQVRRLLKECMTLADDSDRIFFLASPEMAMDLLSLKGIQLEEVSAEEILSRLAKMTPEDSQKG